MQYRPYGKTGLKVSALGFGAMRLPMTDDDKAVDRRLALPMFRAAFEGGVNYIDSAVGYCAEDSQRVCGEALEDWFKDHPRESIIVSTKNPRYDKTDRKTWWTNLENSLERMRVAQLDVYHHHFMGMKSFTEHVDGPDGLYTLMEKARDQGLVRFLAFSWHDTPENLMTVIRTGKFDAMTVQYNLIDRKNEEAIALAHDRGMAVMIMGPVAGGRLGATAGPMAEHLPKHVATTPELALRFVLSNPNVSVALSGMSTMQQVTENVATALRTEPLTADEKAETESAMQRLKKLADIYCTECRYCEPCPQDVRIADVFSHLIIHKVYGAEERAVGGYKFMANQNKTSGKKLAEGCVECGQCEPKCPQKIPIIAQLKEARRLLERD